MNIFKRWRNIDGEESRTMREMLEEHLEKRRYPGRIEEVTADLVKET